MSIDKTSVTAAPARVDTAFVAFDCQDELIAPFETLANVARLTNQTPAQFRAAVRADRGDGGRNQP